MSRKEYHLHFQLQANKPPLKVADSEGVVLCNCFIKCLWRKTDILGMSKDSSISAWAYVHSWACERLVCSEKCGAVIQAEGQEMAPSPLSGFDSL